MVDDSLFLSQNQVSKMKMPNLTGLLKCLPQPPFFSEGKRQRLTALRTVTIRDNWLIKYQISEHRSSQPAVKVNWKGGQPCLTPLQGSLQRFRCTLEEVLCEERRNIYSSFNIDADVMNPCTLCTHKTQVSHHHL